MKINKKVLVAIKDRDNKSYINLINKKLKTFKNFLEDEIISVLRFTTHNELAKIYLYNYDNSYSYPGVSITFEKTYIRNNQDAEIYFRGLRYNDVYSEIKKWIQNFCGLYGFRLEEVESQSGSESCTFNVIKS